MLEITADKWDQQIWGSSTSTKSSSKIFLFGTNDHWVADKARDELILTRGRPSAYDAVSEAWKPKMLIDEAGIPHSWCIRDSEEVAERTVGFLEEVIDADLAKMPVPRGSAAPNGRQ